MKKRFLSLILAIVMVIGMAPAMALTASATDTVEAKWGASADALTGSGTLEAAIAAAAADSNIKYIQLQSNLENTGYLITSGEFTIDLNGKNVTFDSYTFSIRNGGTKVTFIDTADTDGKVSSTELGASAVIVMKGASVIIDGGKFEGGYAVKVDDSSSSVTIKSGDFTSIDWRTINNFGTLVIEGGSFTSGDRSAVLAGNSSVSTTVKGGSFNAGERGTIEYYGGLLDLSEYSEISGVSVYNATSTTVVLGDTTIKLPSGYCFYYSDNKAVVSLAVNTKYTVGEGETPELVIEAKWGASADALTGSGTLAAAIDAAEADSNIKYIQLQSNVTFSSELEGIIASGEFTIDLNGKNVTSDAYTFTIRNSGTKVTFIDTADTDGKVSTTGSAYSAVVVRDGASVIIDGGQFEGGYVADVYDSSSSATIKNGVFTSIRTRTIRNGGILVIEGGSFTAGDWSAVCAGTSSVSTTVKGGSFTTGGRGTIEYYGGLLDLSEYSEISGISVYNFTSAAVVPGDTTIKLPEGYCFYDSDNKAVASLEVNTKYTVGEGEAPELVIEAKWGASADALTGSGTLEAAIAAAAADSNIKYIQLQSDVTSTSSNLIESGEFTIDLNGKNVTSDAYTFYIRNSGTKVTFIDTADTDGKVSSTELGACAVNVSEGASVIIDGGKFEGGGAVYVDDSISSATIKSGEFTSIDWRTISNSGTLVIEGGSFNAGSRSAVCAGSLSVSTTIKGGSFIAGDHGTIEYYDGLLDLSEYSEISGISVSNYTSAAVVPGDTTIKLPEGYCFYDGEEATTVLEYNTKYTVGTAPETKYTVSFKANGGTGSMANDISYGKYQLPENAFTAPEGKEFASWLVGDTEYAPGDIIEITTDTAVSAVWQNVTAKITLEMTDSYGDGWVGNVLEVYVGEELVNSFALANGSSGTASMNYDATKTYDFVWVKGYYPDECSFVIKVNGESVFTADRTACEGYENNYTVYTLNPKLELAGASITVGQDLTMNYLVKVLDTEAIDVTKLSARFTMNDKSVTVSAGELRADGAYPFAFEKIAPQYMGDNIYAEILLDGKVIAVVEEYSVKENAQKLLSTYADDEKLVQLVTDLLYYGAAAQNYRGYKTDALVTDGVTGMVAPSNTVPTTTDRAVTASTSNTAYFVSVGVWFDNVNKIYVNLSTTDNVTLKVNGKAVELDGTPYYTDAIYAIDFDDVYTFELYEGETLVQTLTYSVKSYVYSMANGTTSNESMIALAKALYAYGKSAEAYKG